jgi:hypothetical protein
MSTYEEEDEDDYLSADDPRVVALLQAHNQARTRPIQRF